MTDLNFSFNNEGKSKEEIHRRVKEDIRIYGWSVLATEYQEQMFSHTVGLEKNFNHPEFEIYGLSEEIETLFLNELASRVKAGQKFKRGDVLTDLVEDYELILVINPSDPKSEISLTNNRLRIIWPDSNHLYPWDNDCEEECGRQRLIPDSTLPLQQLYEELLSQPEKMLV